MKFLRKNELMALVLPFTKKEKNKTNNLHTIFIKMRFSIIHRNKHINSEIREKQYEEGIN